MKMKSLLVSALLIALFLSVQVKSQSQDKLEGPYLISSAGQSADVTLASTLLRKIKVEHKVSAMAKESELNGIKTLIIVPGFSSKGLGAAGISREQEMERVKNLISTAKNQKVKIFMLHIGGKARRGPQSDDFNSLVAQSSSNMVVVAQGDEDQFFSKIATSKKIKIKVVDKIADTIPSLKELLN